MIDTFDELFMNEAYLYASKSKDPSTQVGAVIVRDKVSIMRGYNGPLRGVDDTNPKIFEKPYKSYAMEHAERNAIYNCAREGISCKGCTMYVTWSPCHECAKAIIQSGITRVIIHKDAPTHSNEITKENQKFGLEFLNDCGVQVDYWSGRMLIKNIRFDNKNYVWRFDQRWET